MACHLADCPTGGVRHKILLNKIDFLSFSFSFSFSFYFFLSCEQVVFADKILLNKIDLVSEDYLAQARVYLSLSLPL